MELNSKATGKQALGSSTAAIVVEKLLGKEEDTVVKQGGRADSASDNEVFVSVKSINISGSGPDLPTLVVGTEGESGLNSGNVAGSRNLEGGGGGGESNNEQSNLSKSETSGRVLLVPRVCSDSHIGEGEGFHSSRLSSSASLGSLSSAVFLAVGISSEEGSKTASSAAHPPVVEDGVSGDKKTKKKCQSGGNEARAENVNAELGESLHVSFGNTTHSSSGGSGGGKSKGKTLLGVLGPACPTKDVKTEPEESDIDLDTDSSIQVEHDLSVGNTKDFVEDELLEEYDEPDDELHRELEQIFETDLIPSGGVAKGGHRGGSRFSPCKSKRSKYVDSATWTQEDDMPSSLSDLSPVQSPKKKSSHSSSSKGRVHSSGLAETSGHHSTSSTAAGHYPGGQFDHQYQYHSHHQSHKVGGGGGIGGHPGSRRHPQQQGQQAPQSGSGSSRNGKSHHRIHQSQSNQRLTGNSSGGLGSEFIHQNQPQQHPVQECYTVSSQLLSREARLYENFPTTQGELETLEILLTGGESCNYPTSGGGGGFGRNNSNPKASTSRNSLYKTNNGGGGGSGSGSGGSSGTNNNNHILLHYHHHSASNLNSSPGPGSIRNSVEQLFSVSELLGPGSCLAVGGSGGGIGGGCGPPSRTSWVDSGRESLSFDGENNNSGGSSRNLLLIPPPPPPPINYQGFVNSSIIMQAHHTSNQSPSHNSQAHSSRKSGSRRDRLVRQKQAIDETFLPIPTNSTDNLGIDQGGTGGGCGYLAVPSPRRTGGMMANNLIAANFCNAAASPISLHRHPPASQIMLHENKKNKPLIPCDSPYGIMTGGHGNGDWTFGGGTDKKGGQMSRDLLRCRSPQRTGRSRGKNSHNQSFDYGELPSQHQMFPKRHLLSSRQLSSYNNHQQGFIPASGGSQIGNNNPALILQPQQQHRSFPVGLFSGGAPKSCSMGDLTSSTASPNKRPPNHSNHHNCQSFHGKASDEVALCPPHPNPASLVTSLPLPPQTSVTYEFSLAPQSGTLAPGWNLTAVQRGLATAVPLAAAVARRRLPRPRTMRPRFGFTDKNEARKAKWTIVVTALALLAMSILLVAITLRLAPLIDDLGKRGCLPPIIFLQSGYGYVSACFVCKLI
ncbi:hypothetical protein Fcan01_07488 [Folsomia candida]|uniref:Uncharacterized protein n=1 Tax=Folsomia candida TaxID=158441 RepID=A0A226EK22_FOLCA|nr:hypothetical protein Fcan01_07488 [Folsomia candida]